ncbi:MAG: Uma2 family endonuclease [Chthoniobacteraceae bacterium]
MSVLAPTYKFTVEEYHKLADAGFFGEDDRIELLNGELIVMHAIGKRHAQAVTNLNMDFAEHARRRFMVSPQNPVWLDEMSEPEPDIVLVPWRRKAGDSHPQPRDVFLIVEVADSSLRYDRRDKMRAYARVGIREFWILNLEENVMEVFRTPVVENYAETERVVAGETLSPLAFPDVTLSIDEIIP